MAKLFYHNSSINLNKGDELTFSFLVPLNQLFEMLIFKTLKEAVGTEVSVIYQGPSNHLGIVNGKKNYHLRPDISVIKDDRVVMILDAKYKEAIDVVGNYLVSQSDIYQMLAYSVRYKCNNIVLVYPKMMGNKCDNMEIFRVEIPKDDNQVLDIRIVQVDLESDIDLIGSKLLRYL